MNKQQPTYTDIVPMKMTVEQLRAAMQVKKGTR